MLLIKILNLKQLADIERSLGITLTDEEKEVLDYLSGQKKQMKDFLR